MVKPGFHDSNAVRAGALEGALRPRILGLAESLPGPSWCAVLIENGAGAVAGEAQSITGPALGWRPWGGRSRIRFEAGAVGTYVLLGESALANAIGHMPESRDLRAIAERVVTVSLAGNRGAMAPMRAAFLGIRRELGSGGAAARAVVEAYLRVILVTVYRAALPDGEEPDRASPSHRTFRRFSALVEQHFRSRWTVNDYAAALGLTRDRLGDVCRRVRGLGPKEVIDRRAMREAQLLLETSGLSVGEIAGALGFASAAPFSRFFARHAAQPPGAYRAAFLRGAETGVSDPARLFDWP